MTKKESQAIELLTEMIKGLSSQIGDLSKKSSHDIETVHTKIDNHITEDCSTQKELSEHKKGHSNAITSWIAVAGVVTAILIAVFK